MKKLALFLLFFMMITGAAIAQQQHGTGVILDDSAYSKPIPVPVAAKDTAHKLPPGFSQSIYVEPHSYISFKAYTPIPKEQECESCVGWACAYAGLTTMWAIQHGVTDKEKITQNAYDPMYLFYSLTENCNKGTDILAALKLMKDQGLVLSKDLGSPVAGRTIVAPNKLHKIAYFNKLFELHTDNFNIVVAVHASLYNSEPVVVVGLIDSNLFNLDKKHTTWVPKMVREAHPMYHAMCVIGFNDNTHQFELMNSWGTDWGNDGYFYISYDDFALMARYAFLMLPTDYNGNMGIIDVNGDFLIEKSPAGAKMKFSEIHPVLTSGQYVVEKGIKAGDVYKFDLFNLKENRYVYMIGLGPNNKAVVLYSGDNPPVQAKTAIVNKIYSNLSVTPLYNGSSGAAPGNYEYCVLYSYKPINIYDAVQQINQEKGSHNLRKLRDILGARFIPESCIKYETSSITAQGLLSTGDVSPVFLRIAVTK